MKAASSRFSASTWAIPRDGKRTAAKLETDISNRGHVITHEALLGLPLNGRNCADLASLVPGVRKAVQSNTANCDAAYDVNGMRSALNTFNMDGIDNNAYGTSNQGFSSAWTTTTTAPSSGRRQAR